MPLVHQTSRGDLLRWIKCCKTDEEKCLSAQLLGYEWREPQPAITDPMGEMSCPQPIGETSKQAGQPSIATAVQQRPHKVFYALSRYERYASHEDKDDGLPANLRDVEPLWDSELQPFDEGLSFQYQPLLAERRLLPFLRQSLAYTLGHRPDIPQLIKRVTQLQTLQSLPRQPHTVPVGRLYVVVDMSRRLRPFWKDGHAVCRMILRMYGRNNLDIRVVEDGLQNLYWDWFDGQQRLQPWTRLKSPSKVLILSDMGQLSAEGSTVRQHWLRFAQRLQYQGLCPVVLSPISPQHQCSQLQALTHQILWGKHSRLRPQKPNQRLEEHAAHVQRVIGLLSVAAHIEPELLRAVLACLPAHQADSGVEADVYQHPDMVWGHTAISLRPEQRGKWQARFRQEPAALQRKVMALLQQHHIGQFPAVVAEEVMNAQPLVNFPTEDLVYLQQAKEFMVRFTRRFAGETGHSGMVQFARRHLERLGTDELGHALGRDSYSSALYGLAYREQLAGGLEVPEAYDAGIVKAILGRGRELRKYVVMQVDGDLYLELDTGGGLAKRVGIPLAHTLSWQTVLGVNIDGKCTIIALQTKTLVCHLETVESIQLDTGLERLHIQCITPNWASHIGRDTYGLFADLEISGSTQRFRWIKPGTFLMGSPQSESERYDDEVQHSVTLTQGFWLADTTVTQAQWQAVMGNNPSNFKAGPNYPVEEVSWDDANAFVEKLRQQIPGLQTKLPTEAQWEYACRAGTTTRFSFGDDITYKQVNYMRTVYYEYGEPKTIPVKSLPANQWGLYEMHGNVWEWTQDVWQQKLSAKPVKDPGEFAGRGNAGVRRVIRGGCWDYERRVCRSACRFGRDPSVRSDCLGFRLVLR